MAVDATRTVIFIKCFFIITKMITFISISDPFFFTYMTALLEFIIPEMMILVYVDLNMFPLEISKIVIFKKVFRMTAHLIKAIKKIIFIIFLVFFYS